MAVGMNLPNALTMSRLLAIPAVVAMLVADFPYHDQLAAVVFAAASLTDTLDGNLARWRGQVTELGKFLDPLSDKLFVLSVLVVLVGEGLLAAWVVGVIAGREVLITVLRSMSARQGRVMSASPWGKTKTVVQIAAVLLLILERPYPVLHEPAQAGVAVAVAFTIFSGLDYLWRFRRVLRHAARRPAAPEAGQVPAGLETPDPKPGGDGPVG
jgi:CDP-diacylglycerol--glycerol-3-phosphate 3-phosphatidyltransferase